MSSKGGGVPAASSANRPADELALVPAPDAVAPLPPAEDSAAETAAMAAAAVAAASQAAQPSPGEAEVPLPALLPLDPPDPDVDVVDAVQQAGAAAEGGASEASNDPPPHSPLPYQSADAPAVAAAPQAASPAADQKDEGVEAAVERGIGGEPSTAAKAAAAAFAAAASAALAARRGGGGGRPAAQAPTPKARRSLSTAMKTPSSARRKTRTPGSYAGAGAAIVGGFEDHAAPPVTPSASAAVRFERDLSAARDAEEAAVRMQRVVERMRERVEVLRIELREVQGSDDVDAAEMEAEAEAERAMLAVAAAEGSLAHLEDSAAVPKKKKKIGRGTKCDPNWVTPDMVETMLDRPWTVKDKSGPDKRGNSLRYKAGGVYCAACEKNVSFYLMSQHIIGPRHMRALDAYKRRISGANVDVQGGRNVDPDADPEKAAKDAAAAEWEARATALLRRLHVAQAALVDAERTLAGTERVAETFRHSAEAARGEMGVEAETMKREAEEAKAEAAFLKAKLEATERHAAAREAAHATRGTPKVREITTTGKKRKSEAHAVAQADAAPVAEDYVDYGYLEAFGDEDQQGGEPTTPDSKKGRGAKREPEAITQEMVDNVIAKPWRKGPHSGPDKNGHSLTFFNNGLYCQACRKNVSFYLASQHILGARHVKMLEEYQLRGMMV